jgi:hypothetical protein
MPDRSLIATAAVFWRSYLSLAIAGMLSLSLNGQATGSEAWKPCPSPTPSAKGDGDPVLACAPYIMMGHFTNHSTLVWRTDVPSDSWVDYGLTTAYGMAAGDDAQVLLHEVTVTDLQPGQTYHYRVRSGGVELAASSFRSGKAPGQPIRVGLMADHRSGSGGPTAAMMESVKPDLILDAGDLADWCSLELLDTQFFNVFAGVLGQCPFYWSPGNHEGDGCAPYLRVFGALPDDHQSYSIEYGDLLVISINSVAPPSPDWLREKLAGSTRPWRMVFTHYPMYSAYGAHGDWDGALLKSDYLPIMEQYRVAAVLAGHNHYYWRGHPTNGVNHLVVGACGAPIYWLGSLPPYTAGANDSLQVMAFADLDGDYMHLRSLDQNSNQVDEVVFDRTCPFELDGALDATAFPVATEGSMNLYAAIGGRYLYLAATDASDTDLFVFLSRTNRETLVSLANWAKTGKVMAWEVLLSGQGGSLSNGWFNGEGLPLGSLRVARAASRMAKDGVLEGVIDLAAVFGAVPPVIYLAAGAYGMEPDGALQRQCPPGDGDGDIDPREFITLPTAMIRLPEPPPCRVTVENSDGRILLRAQGPPKALHAFETSGDLQTWSLLRSMPASEDGIAEWVDAESALWGTRFYRTRQLWP